MSYHYLCLKKIDELMNEQIIPNVYYADGIVFHNNKKIHYNPKNKLLTIDYQEYNISFYQEYNTLNIKTNKFDITFYKNKYSVIFSDIEILNTDCDNSEIPMQEYFLRNNKSQCTLYKNNKVVLVYYINLPLLAVFDNDIVISPSKHFIFLTKDYYRCNISYGEIKHRYLFNIMKDNLIESTLYYKITEGNFLLYSQLIKININYLVKRDESVIDLIIKKVINKSIKTKIKIVVDYDEDNGEHTNIKEKYTIDNYIFNAENNNYQSGKNIYTNEVTYLKNILDNPPDYLI